MDANEREELVDLVAQAVIDRIEERRQVNMLVEMVMQRMSAIERQQALPPELALSQPNARCEET
jgi:hypothetical protein